MLTDQDRELLLDRADFFYAHSAELIGGEPGGPAKLSIAFVEPTCGLGCGYIGTKGVEILSTQTSTTTIRDWLGKTLTPYLESPEADWSNCVSTGSCDIAYTEPPGDDFAPELPVQLPNQISGEILEDDTDAFTFDLPNPMEIEIVLCSDGFQGWVFVHESDGSWLGFQYVFQNECVRSRYFLDEARVWRFSVAMNAASLPGHYRVSVAAAERWPRSAWGVPDPVVEDEFPATLGTRSVAPDPAYPPSDARFWVQGLGFVATAPYAGNASASFDSGPGPGTYACRVQLLSDGVPATDWTPTESFALPEPGSAQMLELTRLRGLPNTWGSGVRGVQDAEGKRTVPAGAAEAAGGAGASGSKSGFTGRGVRAER